MAVQYHGANGGSTTPLQPGPKESVNDAIRDSKAKAQESVARIATPDALARANGTPGGSGQTNGGPQLSRKRSRDGSLKPVSAPKVSKDSSTTPAPLHDEVMLDRYIQRDLFHIVAMNDQCEHMKNLGLSMREKDAYMNEVNQQRRLDPGAVFGPGFRGYGNRTTDTGSLRMPETGKKIQPMYSALRPPPKTRRARQLYVPRKANAQQAEQHEELVPVRLDIELDKIRLRDTFTWNLHENLVSQDVFIEYLLEDLKIPPENMHEVARQVKQEMQDQIDNFYPHIIVEDGPLELARPYNEHKDDEMRIRIWINITIGRITLVDQFEWDINNPLNSPEEFAERMALENALSGEFTTAIAHSIREQSQLYTKSLYLTNHCFDGRLVEDPELKDGFLSNPPHSIFRPVQAQKDWMPLMYEMTEADLERTELSMMREHRAQKRQLNRRGGPALPDLKDRQRTVRSLIMHSVIPGAVDTFETTGIPKTRRSGRAGRRGAARTDGDAESEDLDSDASADDSPAPSALANAGTARTRNMRGAASAAQAAMRANLGRSVTPDLQTTPLDTHRTSARRSMLRDESVHDDDTLIVKLKIGRARLKALVEENRAKKRASEYPLSGYASQPPLPGLTRPSIHLSAGKSKPIPSTSQPNGNNAPHLPVKSTDAPQYDERGHIDISHWPHPNDPTVCYLSLPYDFSPSALTNSISHTAPTSTLPHSSPHHAPHRPSRSQHLRPTTPLLPHALPTPHHRQDSQTLPRRHGT